MIPADTNVPSNSSKLINTLGRLPARELTMLGRNLCIISPGEWNLHHVRVSIYMPPTARVLEPEKYFRTGGRLTLAYQEIPYEATPAPGFNSFSRIASLHQSIPSRNSLLNRTTAVQFLSGRSGRSVNLKSCHTKYFRPEAQRSHSTVSR